MNNARVPEVDTAQPAQLVDSGASPDMRSIQLKALEGKIRTLKRQVENMQRALHDRNVELDALHHVWCDGGCTSGTHRWSEQTITEEVVAEAERNTKRLRRWFESFKYRNKMGWNGPTPVSPSDDRQ
jgi:hypothetical protein